MIKGERVNSYGELNDIMETITMIQDENLDIRTITMGISLIDCADSDIDRSCEKVYRKKIGHHAKDLVKTGESIEQKYGIPIVNKRISVTPISMLVAASAVIGKKYARTLDRAAKAVGVNFIGGFSALVQKGFSAGDRELIDAIPQALSRDGVGLFFCQRRLDQSRYQYGRCQDHGRCDPKDC